MFLETFLALWRSVTCNAAAKMTPLTPVEEVVQLDVSSAVPIEQRFASPPPPPRYISFNSLLTLPNPLQQ